MILTGFHGTNSDNVSNIQTSNFHLSENPDDWLGKGVYFFIKGITCPSSNAIEWARNKAYDKKKQKNHYQNYSVLKTSIELDNVFDTRSQDALLVFNILRDAILKKHRLLFKASNALHENDKIIWDIISDDSRLDGVIHNLYIRNQFQRIKRVNSNVPNTTVLCVKNNSSINLSSIDVVKEGMV